jgi:Arc/MetJ-type ribon-helix-helix transcriptional regulator
MAEPTTVQLAPAVLILAPGLVTLRIAELVPQSLTNDQMWATMWIGIAISIGSEVMKTIQMTIDEPLLTKVDQVIEKMDTTRSAFIRDALRLALRQHKIAEMEQQHAEGYARHPIAEGEFDVWQDEPVV